MQQVIQHQVVPQIQSGFHLAPSQTIHVQPHYIQNVNMVSNQNIPSNVYYQVQGNITSNTQCIPASSSNSQLRFVPRFGQKQT